MKWLLILFSIFKPFISTGHGHEMVNPITELKEMIKANAMKVVAVFAVASALATIFAAGIIMIAIDIGAQYDQNAYVYFSSMILMGLVLSLVSLAIGAIIVKRFQDANQKEEQRHIQVNVGGVHPLQDALALLVSDFVKEREMRRNEEVAAPRNRPTPTPPAPHHPAPHDEDPRHH